MAEQQAGDRRRFLLGPQRRGWLFKSEPDTFSWQDLLESPEQTTAWEGVRNFQARNRLRDEVQRGDLVFFYHSSCKKPGIVGIAAVTRPGYPDPSQFDRLSPYFDAKSTLASPRWFVVDVRAKKSFSTDVARQRLVAHPATAHLELCRRGCRLSIQRVDADAWQAILALAELPASS